MAMEPRKRRCGFMACVGYADAQGELVPNGYPVVVGKGKGPPPFAVFSSANHHVFDGKSAFLQVKPPFL